MENSVAPAPKILNPFNYLKWRVDILISLHKKGLYMMILSREIEPQQYIEKSKFINRLDEAFCFMCIHISKEMLFHLEGLKNLKEVWNKLESFFGKWDEPRCHILENELISLQPNKFKTIQ